MRRTAIAIAIVVAIGIGGLALARLAAPAGNKNAMACAMVGALVQQTAKMRDQGVSEQSQVASIDNPSGKLYQLTTGNMLSADTAGTLRAGIRREIAYVYQHREMTPAQLGDRARQSCGTTEGEDAGAPVAHPTRTPSPG